MLEEYDFHILQLRYVREAMNDFANLRPDDLTVALVDIIIASARTTRAAFIDAKSDFDLAMGGRITAHDLLHDGCVSVYGIMRSRFRKDTTSTTAIDRLPVDDKTPGDTLKRGQSMSSLWGKLPNPPGSLTPFKAWDTMDKTAFDALVTALDAKLETFTNETDDYEEAQGNLHKKDREMADLITAALAQGRHQFAEGTPQREVIDAIPTTPAQQPPAKAVISVSTSPAAGQAHLEGDANHATSFDWFRKGPGDADFVKVADDIIQKFYNATGLPPGAYDFKLVGRNSRGTGPESDVSTVNVA
ncbi:MAG: hypothetical protein B9S33_21095 [Pedosphaera sp. Tous-C6FEB]|nr:MAG: hypothetical protein B9S33_21095 [Pedosphaera sp. Tous-C6FEB]